MEQAGVEGQEGRRRTISEMARGTWSGSLRLRGKWRRSQENTVRSKTRVKVDDGSGD